MAVIEDWSRPWDPWCTYTESKGVKPDYNVNDVKRITQKIVDGYTPEGGYCVTCEGPEFYKGVKGWCYRNNHPCPYTVRKDYPGSSYYIVETRMTKSNPLTILMRRGLLFWNYDRKCPFIFRANKLNGLSLHHKDENVYNDNPWNTACINTHPGIHQSKKRLIRMLRDSERLITEVPSKELVSIAREQQKILREMLGRIENIQDSPKVAEIIKYVRTILKERGLLF